MPGSLPVYRGDMEVDPEFPALSNKSDPPSPPREARKAPRSTQEQQQQPQEQQQQPRVQQQLPQDPLQLPLEPQHPPDTQTKVTFLLRACNGARVFSHPGRVSHALHTSPLGKCIIEGETRSLGNGSALVVALWESVIPKVPILQDVTFTLRDWQVTCRRAERAGALAQYGKVGPLSEEIKDLEEIRSTLRALDGSDIEEVSWIPPRSLPRSTTGRRIRLKVTGSLPSRVCIGQLVFWPQPYLLPILRCLACLKVGHSINTCRSSVRCGRCSGPHPSQGAEVACDRPFRCFQCGGHHGPRSAHCPFNQEAQELYGRLVQEGMPIPDINSRLRLLPLTKFQPPPPSRPPTMPSPMAASPPRAVHPDVAYSSVATGNRYTVLQDLTEDDDPPRDPLPPSPPFLAARSPRPRRYVRSPRQPAAPMAPAGGSYFPASPGDPTHFTTEADVHHPPSFLSRDGAVPASSAPRAASRPQRLPGPPPPPNTPHLRPPPHPVPSTTRHNVMPQIFTLLMEAYRLYHQGSSVPAILANLWPALSSVLNVFLQC
ncbi:hypothetical protein GWK47_003764 [Chionoecetes opilio]|uniref:Gag-like protein n=1 Tax=Chionoecetes opilio TaxID=41210 RepID=A0A8J5CPW0_CHIOP|nr:hypothetical protein GWK47_003764 [Chionoecetes opilio]